MTEDPADEALVRRVAEGDRTAYAMLVRRHGLRFRALAYRMLGAVDLAEDAVQDSFVKLWTHAARFDPEKARFTTWFHRIVVNRCLDEKRKVTPVALPEGYDAPDPAAGAEAELADQGDQATVRAALQALPDRQRMAVALSYFDGLSNKEAAEVMDLKMKAFESLLVRARTNLKQQLMAEKDRLFTVVD
ncbi:sigma-70 family RNA polymerase sigma factor [Kordiimonas marina]|uniref:sigma-70 family RNA polymerase sigma factor n=1 Tax=Kordiimonas marina TaxID=2872312 RepID=UPI001FF1BA02|nr:sigma-70 family RNA polymerase sigma factor [Kordiimonas marina]MCJ9429901.1 sigma-70 family RNA polymerase sigma factor [Kordiimonas marina]